MSAERLFRILGLVDEDLVAEASTVREKNTSPPAGIPQQKPLWPWRRLAAAAACFTLVCTFGFFYLVTGGFQGMGSAAPDGATSGSSNSTASDGNAGTSGGSIADSASFMSYAGPVLPLTTVEQDTDLAAERTLTWDFTPGVYEDGSSRQWGSTVTDSYTLTNSTDADITVRALYPMAGSLADLDGVEPEITVDGEKADAVLYAGSYAGTFRDAGEADGSTWNLSQPETWEDYAALLSDEDYLTQALGDGPALNIPVTVYTFSDFEAPHETYRAATQAVEFTIDPTATTVLTYGFNGSSWDTESGWRRYDYFVPDGVRGESDLKVLIVLGEDIKGYTLQGYANGACEEAIDGVSCTVSREETTLDTVLAELCQAELRLHEDSSWDFSTLPLSVYEKAAAELLMEQGILSSAGVDRYADGRLDDFLWDVLVQERILYLSFPVTVPAGGSVTVSAEFWKEPSYDFDCAGTDRENVQGFDLLTTAGSALTFSSQHASAVHVDGISLGAQDLGFDWQADVMKVTLDCSQAHYSFEIYPLEP